MFPDSSVKQYAAYVISMNILIQVDSDGHNSKTLYAIVDYNQDNSDISKSNTFVIINRGIRNPRKTIIGCKFII